MLRHQQGDIMAIDVYLQIDGIQGESADSEHQGWIECTSVNWKLHQPRSATASTAGGHTAERAELSDVSLTKLCDVASPIPSDPYNVSAEELWQWVGHPENAKTRKATSTCCATTSFIASPARAATSTGTRSSAGSGNALD
jgi:hypothetical protein